MYAYNYEFLETEINKNGLQIGSQIIIIGVNDVIPKYLVLRGLIFVTLIYFLYNNLK